MTLTDTSTPAGNVATGPVGPGKHGFGSSYALLIVLLPPLVCYLWICARFYNGVLVLPRSMEQLRQLLASFPDLQIVATSHSPYLIDHLAPEEVRLMITDEGGSVVCARLSDHPELDRWQAFMRAGEIWSMVGEEWVRDRGAQPHA